MIPFNCPSKSLRGLFSSIAAFCISFASSQAELQPDTLKTILPSPTTIPDGRRFFGTATAVSGSIVVVGAHMEDNGGLESGSVYVYDLASGTPTIPVHLIPNPTPA